MHHSGYEESRKDRKKVEMLFAHLKLILKLDRLRLRGPKGARDEFLMAAARAKPESCRRPQRNYSQRACFLAALGIEGPFCGLAR